MTTALQDLQAADAALVTVATAAVALMNTMFAKLAAADVVAAADVEAEVQKINAQVAALQATVTADTAPAPAPAPAA